MIRFLRALGIVLAAAVAIGAGAVMIAGPARFPQWLAAVGMAPGAGLGVSAGGPFRLVNAKTGRTITDVQFRGRWMLIYFGYTFCPDVCPTDLQKMTAALGMMGPDAARIVPIFVTVDPSRDTAETVAQYVALFSPTLVGLTGSQAQIDAAVRAYRVYVRKVPPNAGGGYLIDHSAFMYLMDPRGRLTAIFPADVKTTDLVQALKQALAVAPAS